MSKLLKRENYRFYKDNIEDKIQYFRDFCKFCDAYKDGICPALVGDIEKCQALDRELLKKEELK